jgi:selenoprotein W-related protein
LAAEILTNLKQQVSEMALEPSAGGCFELSVDDKPIFSKLQSGRFPEEGEILRQLKQLAS